MKAQNKRKRYKDISKRKNYFGCFAAFYDTPIQKGAAPLSCPVPPSPSPDRFSVPASALPYLQRADACCLKVLLYILGTGSVEGAEQNLGLEGAEIDRGVGFWLERGVFSCRRGFLTPVFAPSVDNPVNKVEIAKDSGKSFTSDTKSTKNSDSPAKNSTSSFAAKKDPAAMPKYNIEDIRKLSTGNRELAFLLEEVSQKLGKMLTNNDVSTLFSLHDWLGLPVDVILMLVGYCLSIGRSSMRYIEKVAITWADEGINTHDRAGKYIAEQEQRHSLENNLRKMMGLGDRSLTKAEREHIARWSGEYRFPLDVIREAYERSVNQTGKVSFPYTNSILRSWHEKGYRNLADVRQETGARRSKSENKADAGDFDYDEYAALSNARIKDTLSKDP
jgi:DnaD/phage-associated family protein